MKLTFPSLEPVIESHSDYLLAISQFWTGEGGGENTRTCFLESPYQICLIWSNLQSHHFNLSVKVLLFVYLIYLTHRWIGGDSCEDTGSSFLESSHQLCLIWWNLHSHHSKLSLQALMFVYLLFLWFGLEWESWERQPVFFYNPHINYTLFDEIYIPITSTNHWKSWCLFTWYILTFNRRGRSWGHLISFLELLYKLYIIWCTFHSHHANLSMKAIMFLNLLFLGLGHAEEVVRTRDPDFYNSRIIYAFLDVPYIPIPPICP